MSQTTKVGNAARNSPGVSLPVFDWLRTYDKEWLRGDVVAGITLAASLATQPERFYRNSINEPTKP